MPVVDIEGLGEVEFPDEMDPGEIGKTIQDKIVPEISAQKLRATPSMQPAFSTASLPALIQPVNRLETEGPTRIPELTGQDIQEIASDTRRALNEPVTGKEVPHFDVEGNPIFKPEAVRFGNRLIDVINQLQTPSGAASALGLGLSTAVPYVGPLIPAALGAQQIGQGAGEIAGGGSPGEATADILMGAGLELPLAEGLGRYGRLRAEQIRQQRPPTESEQFAAARNITPTEGEQNAIRQQGAGGGVLRAPRSEVELQGVGGGNGPEVPPTGAEAKVSQAAPAKAGENVLPSLIETPEQARQVAAAIGPGLNFDGITPEGLVQYTPRVKGEAWEGATFQVPVGSPPEAVLSRFVEKIEEFNKNPPRRQMAADELEREIIKANEAITGKTETLEEIKAKMRNRPIGSSEPAAPASEGIAPVERPNNLPPHRLPIPADFPAELRPVLDEEGVVFNGGMEAPGGRGIYTVEVFNPKTDPTAQRTAGVSFKKTATPDEVRAKIVAVRRARGWESPVPRPGSTAAAPAKRPVSERPPDIIDDVLAMHGPKSISLKRAREIDPNFKPIGALRHLFSSKGRNEIDTVLSGLKLHGLHRGAETEDEFLTALQDAARGRTAYRKGQATAKRAMDREEAQRVDFEKTIMTGKRKAGERAAGGPIHVGELTEGDTFTLAGQKATVTDMVFDPETQELAYVEISDGRRFGVQTIGGDEFIQPDEGSLEKNPENPFYKENRRPYSRSVFDMSDAELEDIAKDPPRGTVGSAAPTQTYTFRDFPEFAQWMDERYAERDLEGMALGYSDVGAALKVGYIKANRGSAEHKKNWISHLATGSPLEPSDPPLPRTTARPNPPSMGRTTGRTPPPPAGPRQQPAPPPPRPPSGRSPFDVQALVQLLRTFERYPRINRALRTAYGRYLTEPQLVELKQRLFYDTALATRVLAHEIGHFIDLAITEPGKGKQFGQRWQPLRDFTNDIKAKKDLREAAKSLSRAWRGPFTNSDRYRNSADELFADAMSALLTKPEWVNQNFPLIHDSFVELLRGKPAFKAAYEDLISTLKGGNLAEEASIQLDDAFTQSISDFAHQEGPERIGFYDAVRRNLISKWFRAFDVEGKPHALGNRMVDKLEDNDLMAMRESSILSSRFQRNVQPLIDKIKGGGMGGRLVVDKSLFVNRIIQERKAAGKWLEQHPDEARELIELVLDAVPELGAKYRGQLSAVQTGEQAYDLMAMIVREAYDMGDATVKRIQKTVDKYDDDHGEDTVKGAALLQAFNVRGKLLNPSGYTPERAAQLALSINKSLSSEERTALNSATTEFFKLTSGVMQNAKDLGLISDKTWKELIEPNLDNYIPFAVLDYWNNRVSAGIQPQHGTAKDIADPILASQLKMAGMFNWMQRQLSTMMLMETYQRGGAPVTVGPVLKGYGALDRLRKQNSGDRISRLGLWVDGKLHVVEFPGDPGKTFEQAVERPSFLKDLALWTHSPVGRVSRNVLSLYTTLSPSFQLYRNAIRDFHTSAQRVGYTPALKRTAKIAEAAKMAANYAAAAFGTPMLPEVEKLVAIGALPPPPLSRAFYTDHELMDQLIQSGGITALQVHPGRPTDPKGKLPEWTRDVYHKAEQVSAAMEAIPKIQTYYAGLQSGMTPEQSAAFARRAGIPNPTVGGKWSSFLEAFFPWTRVHLQGIRTTVDVSRDPKFNKAFFARVLAFEMTPRLVRLAIGAGLVSLLFQKDRKDDKSWTATLGEHFRRSSPYKNALDNLIPVGWRDPRTGKFIPLKDTFGMKASEIPVHWEAVSYRMPSSEEGKLWGSFLWNALSGMSKDLSRAGKGPVENVGDWVLSQALPGVNPTFGIAQRQYSLWLQGRNPVDPFRGQPVANEELYKAGGINRVEANFGAMINELGDAGKVVAFVANSLGMDPRATSPLSRTQEKPAAISQLPLTSAMFSFDNYARFRDEKNAELDEQKYGARARLLLSPEVRGLYDYYVSNAGHQKTMDDVERQKFYIARSWHSNVWGDRTQPARMYARALSAVMPDGSSDARDTVKRDIATLSKAYVDQFNLQK